MRERNEIRRERLFASVSGCRILTCHLSLPEIGKSPGLWGNYFPRRAVDDTINGHTMIPCPQGMRVASCLMLSLAMTTCGIACVVAAGTEGARQRHPA